MRRAADTPAGIAGGRGEFTRMRIRYIAFALDADIPDFPRESAAKALGGQLDFSRDISTLREQGAGTPPRVNRMGHYILRVVDIGKGPSRKLRGPIVSASSECRHLELALTSERPNVSSGRLRFSRAEDGLYRSEFRVLLQLVRR